MGGRHAAPRGVAQAGKSNQGASQGQPLCGPSWRVNPLGLWAPEGGGACALAAGLLARMTVRGMQRPRESCQRSTAAAIRNGQRASKKEERVQAQLGMRPPHTLALVAGRLRPLGLQESQAGELLV